MDIETCCSERPVVCKCTCNTNAFCGCDVEKIECTICSRIIYGVDSDSVEAWNSGGADD